MIQNDSLPSTHRAQQHADTMVHHKEAPVAASAVKATVAEAKTATVAEAKTATVALVDTAQASAPAVQTNKMETRQCADSVKKEAAPAAVEKMYVSWPLTGKSSGAFVLNDTLPVRGDHSGLLSDAVPFRLHNQALPTCIFLLTALLSFIALRRDYHYLVLQMKLLFSHNEKVDPINSQTARETRFDLFLFIQFGMMLGTVMYCVIQRCLTPANSVLNPLLLLAFCVSASLLMQLLKLFAYKLVNWIFFNKEKRDKWKKCYWAIISLQSFMLLFSGLILMYSPIYWVYCVFLCAFALIMGQIWLLWKTFSIFLDKRIGTLLIILYFCTLEIAPLLVCVAFTFKAVQHWLVTI